MSGFNYYEKHGAGGTLRYRWDGGNVHELLTPNGWVNSDQLVWYVISGDNRLDHIEGTPDWA